MKKHLEMLQQHSATTKLDAEERQEMRDSLVSYITKNPVPEGPLYPVRTSGSYRWALFAGITILVVVIVILLVMFMK
jgi:hypothetical protein